MSAREKSELFGGAAGAAKAKPKAPSATQAAAARPTSATAAASRTAGAASHSAVVDSQATRDRHALQRKEAALARTTAEGYMTKTWKRWHCDYFSAAPHFEKAGAAYRAVGEDEAAIEMYAQAAECHCETSSWVTAAKDYKEAAQLALKLGQDARAAELHHSAAAAWQSGAEPGKAGESLGKSAGILEARDEDAAAAAYKLAVDTMVPPGCNSHSMDFVKIIGVREVFDQAIRFLLGARRFTEAVHVIQRYCVFAEAEGTGHTLHKMFLTECIVLLAAGDYVAADRAYKETHLQDSAYLQAAECKVCSL
jgi:tetratricopeptide (TPR) repeat protein